MTLLRQPDTAPHPEARDSRDASSLVRALRSVAATVDRETSRALEPHGLTSAQYAVLQVMDEVRNPDDAMACSELGRRLTGVAPDVTRLLDRLESGGMVSRNRDSKDRRVVHTLITEKGRTVLHQARPDVERVEAAVLAELTPDGRLSLAELLSALQSGPAGN